MENLTVAEFNAVSYVESVLVEHFKSISVEVQHHYGQIDRHKSELARAESRLDESIAKRDALMAEIDLVKKRENNG